MSVDFWKDTLRNAERAYSSHRPNLLSAAKATGVDVSEFLAGTKLISREEAVTATADALNKAGKAVETAHLDPSAGGRAMNVWLDRVMAARAAAKKEADNDRETDPTPYPDSPDDDDEGDDTPVDEDDQDEAGKRRRRAKKKAKDELVEGDDDASNAATFFQTSSAAAAPEYWREVRASAKAIIAAGAKCRAGTAGTELPENPMARAIVLAGKKRRGEIE